MMELGANAERLVVLGSDPIGEEFASEVIEFSVPPELLRELASLLQAKNGFFAFESALLVRPIRSAGCIHGLLEWNAREMWRGGYLGADGTGLFFAEDAFGFQFALGSSGVSMFDPETASHRWLADSLDDWCRLVREDYRRQTGHPLMRAWQLRHGAIAPGKRLAPTTPFFLGGKFEVENLAAVNDLECMRLRAHIYQKTKDLPDGAKVRLAVD